MSTELKDKKYLVIVQCHIVKEKCPGYLCEKAYNDRTGGFASYPAGDIRKINLTCGGCCGRALHRKLSLLLRTLAKRDNITKNQVIVQLSSCITQDNYHGPPCPHIDYLTTLIDRLGLDYRKDTVISATAEKRRARGTWTKTD